MLSRPHQVAPFLDREMYFIYVWILTQPPALNQQDLLVSDRISKLEFRLGLS